MLNDLTILRLFDEIRANLLHGINVLDIDQIWIDYWQNKYCQIIGVLAAPPCTHFAVSGAQYWLAKDVTVKTAEAVALVHKTLNIINIINPIFWAVENPIGRIPTLVPKLGSPWYWQPWWYGDKWTKKTALYGQFVHPTQQNSPTYYNPQKSRQETVQGSWLQKLKGTSITTKTLRSRTPLGFAYAFAEAQGAFHVCTAI